MQKILKDCVILGGLMLVCGGAAFAQAQTEAGKTTMEDCGQVAALQQSVKEKETQLRDWAELTRYRKARGFSRRFDHRRMG
jgi:hypothetical protein